MLFVQKDQTLRDFMIQFQRDMYVYPDDSAAHHQMARHGISFDFSEDTDEQGNAIRDIVISQEANPEKNFKKMIFKGQLKSALDDLLAENVDETDGLSLIQLQRYLSKQLAVSPLEQTVYAKDGTVEYKRTEWYDDKNKVVQCIDEKDTDKKEVPQKRTNSTVLIKLVALGAAVLLAFGGAVAAQKCVQHKLPPKDTSYQRQ